MLIIAIIVIGVLIVLGFVFREKVKEWFNIVKGWFTSKDEVKSDQNLNSRGKPRQPRS